MSTQTSEQMAAPRDSAFGKGFRFAAAVTSVIGMMIFAEGSAAAGIPGTNTSSNPQPVNVVNTPTVNVGNTPSVNVANTPSVNVANTPAVSISGTPNVNANVQFPANQAVTVTPGSATNVGRLASQQLMLTPDAACGSLVAVIPPDGSSLSCFDMANYPGQVLMITDESWIGAGTSGNTCIAHLGNPNLDLLTSGAVVAADGFTTKTEHLTTGVELAVNPRIGFTGCTFVQFKMQGYLVPNQ